MSLILHGFVFLPAAVFGAVAAICFGVCAIIDRREARSAWPAPALRRAAPPARRNFRPVVIEGGLAANDIAGAIGSLRVPQTPLGSAGTPAATARAARSYGG